MSDFKTLASTATSQYGVLTKQQLEAAGLKDHQLQHRVSKGELRRVHPHVFLIAGTERSWHQRISASALAAAEHTRITGGRVGAASHRSSALLFRFRTLDEDVDVSVRHPRKVTLAGTRVVRSRDLLAEDITWVDGIPTTTPERTICDLGLVFPEHEVMRILRHAVANGLVNRRDVLRMRLRIGKQGRNGAGIVGRCLDGLPDLAELTESGVEVMFLEVCAKYGIPTPVLQLPTIANGRSYRLDFAYPTKKIFVEIDGRWHGTPLQISKDGGRQNDLVAHGWRPIRLDYDQLKFAPAESAQTVLVALSSVPLDLDYLEDQGHRKIG